MEAAQVKNLEDLRSALSEAETAHRWENKKEKEKIELKRTEENRAEENRTKQNRRK